MQARARYLWQRLEAYHGMIYFVPEADAEYTALGLDRGLMGYFASRAAAMGEVSAEVVVATFFNFEPDHIHRLVPEAWRRTSAASLSAARLRAADAALTRLLGDRLRAPDIAEAAGLIRRVCAASDTDGRPLAAAHAALPWPDPPHLALWHGITVMREYRGDGHVAALVAAGVSGCEALVIHAATGAVPAAVLQATRRWSDVAWAAAVSRLRQRGWLDESGSLTPSGIAHRAAVEQRTDDMAAPPWSVLSALEADQLGAVGTELSRVIASAGVFRATPDPD